MVNDNDDWLKPACDYVGRWIKFQMIDYNKVDCVVAIVHREKLIREFGYRGAQERSDLLQRQFRIASQSKAFTAAGIMKLCEQGELKLSHPVGRHVPDLPRHISKITIQQLLSHSAGISRDGVDESSFNGRKPFPDETELRRMLASPPIDEPNSRFKYSNIGFGLLGLVINYISKDYAKLIKREIIDKMALRDTDVDLPSKTMQLAPGLTSYRPVGRKVIRHFQTRALAPAVGFVSTARDLAYFFNKLSPKAKNDILTIESRRKMTRQRWEIPHGYVESADFKPMYYGYGITSGTLANWKWFGHGGVIQGYRTHTVTLAEESLTISVLTNATDGPAADFVDGIVWILRAFFVNWTGAKNVTAEKWSDRWWNLSGVIDLVFMGEKVIVANPLYQNPFDNAPEINTTKPPYRIIRDDGLGHYGEPVRFSNRGQELRLGAVRWVKEKQFKRELKSYRSNR